MKLRFCSNLATKLKKVGFGNKRDSHVWRNSNHDSGKRIYLLGAVAISNSARNLATRRIPLPHICLRKAHKM